MDQDQAKFEGWAVVEIFGHQRFAGYVTTQAFGQAVLFRVDIPPLAEHERLTKHYEWIDGQNIPPGSTVKEDAVQGYTKLFGTGAIYAITPCTEDAAVKAVAAMQTRALRLVALAPERALNTSFVDPYENDRLNDAEPDDDDTDVDGHGAADEDVAP